MSTSRLFASSVPALAACLLVAACGGGGGTTVMSSAIATGNRYSQDMTVTFSGQGFDQGVTAEVDGPCSGWARQAGATATTVQYKCTVTGIGRIFAGLKDNGGQGLGSLVVDVPQPRVLMSVSDGTRTGAIQIELDAVAAPRTVQQFMAYANGGFYNGTLFHRVRPDLAILGGGFVSGTEGVISGKPTTRGDVPFEATGLSHARGTLALYREAGPDSGNAMFFINTVDNPQFNGTPPQGFAVFGRVVSGLEVVDEVAKVPVRSDLSLGVVDVPVTAIRIAAILQTR